MLLGKSKEVNGGNSTGVLSVEVFIKPHKAICKDEAH
jgi:hypothetical protein